MSFSLHILFLFALISSSMTVDYSKDHPMVSQIAIRGNLITKEYIIRREIQHPVNAPFDSLLAMEDRNRIDNLGIFGEVRFFLIPNENGSVILIYEVVETWRYIPFPIFIYQEETGWSYGAGLTVKNFQGRNRLLQIVGAFGGTIFGGLIFQDPWIMGDHISFTSQFFTTAFHHPFLKYDYREIDGEITIGRYFGYHWKFWITGSLEKRWVNYIEKSTTDLQHKYFQTKFQLLYDTRDLYLDPSNGILITNIVQPEFGLGKNYPNNMTWDSQISGYRTLKKGQKKWIMGGSFFFHKYFGKEIPYRIQWIGGTQSVRGFQIITPKNRNNQSHRIGLNTYYASFELRQTLIPKYLTTANTEFGVILVEFFDMGSADDKFGHMFQKTPLLGVGVGLRFFVPGAELLRIDYGMGYDRGKWGVGTWHIDIGHKF